MQHKAKKIFIVLASLLSITAWLMPVPANAAVFSGTRYNDEWCGPTNINGTFYENVRLEVWNDQQLDDKGTSNIHDDRLDLGGNSVDYDAWIQLTGIIPGDPNGHSLNWAVTSVNMKIQKLVNGSYQSAWGNSWNSWQNGYLLDWSWRDRDYHPRLHVNVDIIGLQNCQFNVAWFQSWQ